MFSIFISTGQRKLARAWKFAKFLCHNFLNVSFNQYSSGFHWAFVHKSLLLLPDFAINSYFSTCSGVPLIRNIIVSILPHWENALTCTGEHFCTWRWDCAIMTCRSQINGNIHMENYFLLFGGGGWSCHPLNSVTSVHHYSSLHDTGPHRPIRLCSLCKGLESTNCVKYNVP